MIFYTVLTKSLGEQKTFHYGGGLTDQKLLSLPDILIIEEKPDGIFLIRYTFDNTEVGDTWHITIEDAKHQAEFEYGKSMDKWRKLPKEIKDPVPYILDQLKKN